MEAASNVTAAQGSASAACPASSPLILFLAAVVSSISAQREAERTLKAQEAQQGGGPLAEYDYVVVGGGTAGCVLASRLSQVPLPPQVPASVLLLERGGHEPPESLVPGYTVNNLNSAIAELFNAEPEPQNCNATGCLLNVPDVLGGGSTINGMLYVRGNRLDYDEWARLTADRSWGYENVLRYFKIVEDNLDLATKRDSRYHGHGGPQKVSWMRYRHPITPLLSQAFEAVGVAPRLDINAEGQLGHSVVQTTSAGGERWSTYRSFLEPALQRRNLRVETFAKARRVVLEDCDGGLEAVGVEYEDAAGQTHVVRAKKEVVLTAGALHTPQILMLSGIGPEDQLQALGIPVRRALPVGEGLMDHVVVSAPPYICAPPLCVTDWASRLEDLREYNESRSGPLSSFSMLHYHAYTRSSLADPSTGQQPDLQFLFPGNTVHEDGACQPLDSWRLNRVVPLVCLLRPASRGQVRLNASDPQGHPLVTLNYFGDAAGHDLGVSVEGLKLALSLEKPLAQLNLTLDRSTEPQCLPEGEFGSDAFLRCVARTRSSTEWHWSGTCRMGTADDPAAVLDSRLRVQGVRRLRVADASAMPLIPSGNTNVPTIMLARRAADLIWQDQRGRTGPAGAARKSPPHPRARAPL